MDALTFAIRDGLTAPVPKVPMGPVGAREFVQRVDVNQATHKDTFVKHLPTLVTATAAGGAGGFLGKALHNKFVMPKDYVKTFLGAHDEAKMATIPAEIKDTVEKVFEWSKGYISKATPDGAADSLLDDARGSLANIKRSKAKWAVGIGLLCAGVVLVGKFISDKIANGKKNG